MKSLKYKIMIPVLIMTFLGICLLSGIVYLKAKEIIINDVEEIARNKNEKLITIADDKVNEWKNMIHLLSGMDIVKEKDYEGLKKFASSNGNEFKDFQALIMAGRDGKYKNNKGKAGNIKDRDYFAKVMKGESVVSEPVISKSTGVPIIVIASPIKNDSGQVVGLIGGTVALSKVTDIVNAEKFGETGYGYMINQEGIVIAHPKKELILEYNALETGSDSQIELTRNMVEGKSDVSYYEFDGKKKIAAYGPMKSTGWSIAMTTYNNEVTKSISTLGKIVITIGVAIVALIGIILLLIVTRITKPVKKMTQITNEVASGNLTVKVDVKSNDEIGILASNFNNMIDSMRELINEMKNIGLTVASTSEEMKDSTDEASKVSEQVAVTVSEMAKGATEQAQSSQEGSKMVNDLISEIGKILDNINDSKNLTINAQETVDKGVSILEYQKGKMLENKRATKNVSNEIISLSEKSGQIGQIVELIRNIAEQTNLLALNAAIEAARAGEQGKGFAVVAEEVRKLAEESGTATENISELIKEIQIGVSNVVEEMKNTEEIVDEQENVVNQTSDAFNDILRSVENVTENIKEVTYVCENVSENSQVVSENINSIASIIEENAAGTEEVSASTEEQTAALEEIAASADELADIIRKQQEFIEKFKI
ncbi:methyl-accepting chemotaxis protein [Wukongibacter baidiensis]|uniref:methyl-accepting chemotaxis protein n=1 Tax=Wukongibacter baidiensis TaxID=1723361 RepID=UPI003D7F7B4D